MRSLPVGLLTLLAALGVAACDGGLPSPSTTYEGSPLFTSAARLVRPQRLDRRPSWFAPEIKQRATYLFVSDAGTGDVYLYALPAMKIAARVTGFSQPQGECSDNRGDVWVTDTIAQTIYELSHTGRLLNTLSDKAGYPDACAWDPSTGNLAVMNIFDLASVAGSVLVYPGGTGSPATYANPSQYFYNFGGYDNRGDLFFDGRNADGTFMLSELSSKAGSAETIKVAGTSIYYPGMIQWVGSYLDVGDQSCGNGDATCVYRLAISSKTATVKGVTNLENYNGGAVCDMAQGVVVKGRTIAGSDNDFCGYAPSATYSWPYPGGGLPKAYDIGPDSLPVGAAVSAGQ
ncbi:MAG: hypothetical protein WA814_11985 [Candidatus Baltobacteraceae bacterium]